MNEELLRQELRALDGDLYLCHLFAPAEKRAALLTLYHLYADIARIPASVSDPMVGAIRLQWWRDLLDAVANGDGRGTPIGEALLVNPLPQPDIVRLIDGREAALPEGARGVDELQAEAQIVGPALMRLACRICAAEAPDTLLDKAGTGFELMRLASAGATDVAARAHGMLLDAARDFTGLRRQQRKALLPVFLPIGLARRQASVFPKQRSLLIYQLILLKMALTGRL
jgi:phytoene/squalene synthetase